MIWNWQQEDWPKFSYDKASLEEAEGAFLRQSGILQGSYKHIGDADKTVLTVDLMSDEAYKTSEIEGGYSTGRACIRPFGGISGWIRTKGKSRQPSAASPI